MPARLVRLAAIQDAPVSFLLPESIKKFASLVATAASAPYSADVLVFPEAFLSCYPRGHDFGTVIGSRSEEGREWFKLYYESSVDIEGNSPEWQEILSIVKEYNVVVVLGVIEKDPSKHGSLFCTAVTIGSEGLLWKHRKLLPTASECWKGAAICWENYMPLLRYAMYSLGVEIYCAPTADGRDLWASTMRHIAAEGRCFVVSVNQFATKKDYPANYPPYINDPENSIVCRGGSMIVGPMGDILAGPLFDEAGILCAEVDLNDITRSKLDFDAVGHYARPDIFDLHVNTSSHETVTFRSNPPSQ